ncbi:ankyrin repeat-containing domain protein, partial [Cercophora scortea]
YLLSHNADPNIQATSGQTALLLAILAKNLPIVKLLAAHGANITAVASSATGPLHVAAVAGHPELCHWLVTEAGCAIDARDSGGYTALIHAAGYAEDDAADTVTTLVALGANLETRIYDGRRPLHFAAFKGQPRCAAELIRLGAEVDALDDAGWAPVHFAGRYHHLEVLRVLVEAGADLERGVCGGPQP